MFFKWNSTLSILEKGGSHFWVMSLPRGRAGQNKRLWPELHRGHWTSGILPCSFQPCSSSLWLAFAGVKAVEPFSTLNAKKSLSPAQGVSAESCRWSRSLSGGGWTWTRAWRRLATCLSCPSRTPDSAGAQGRAVTSQASISPNGFLTSQLDPSRRRVRLTLS